MKTLRSMTVLQVSDVPRSEAFYKTLGFHSHGVWEHHGVATFRIVQRGNVTLALQLLNGALRVNTHWATYIYVTDVAALHAAFQGVDIPELPDIRRDNQYGCDDFDVVDPDGHRICFGQDMQPAHGPGLSAHQGAG